MTEQNHHDPAELDKLAESSPCSRTTTRLRRQASPSSTSRLSVRSSRQHGPLTWTKGEGWSDRRIEPYAPLKMDPGASVLHYAQECFEGLKAYRHADGSARLFPSGCERRAFQNSAKRLYLRSCRSTTSSALSPPSSSAM